MGTSQDKGYLFGVSVLRIITLWGLFWGPMVWETTISVLGNKGSCIFGVEGDEAESPAAIGIPSSIPYLPPERYSAGHVILLHR